MDGTGTPDSAQDKGLPRAPYDDHHPGALHPGPSGLLASYGSDPYGRESSTRRHLYLNSARPRHSMSPAMNHSSLLPSPRLPGQSNTIPALHSYLSSQNIPTSGSHMYGSSSSHHSNHHGSSWDRLDTPGKLNDGPAPHGRSSSSGSGSMWPAPEQSSYHGSGSPTGSGPNSSGRGTGQDSNYNFPTLNSPFFPTPSQMFNSNTNSSSSSNGGAGGGGGSSGTGGNGGSSGGAFGGGNQLPPPGGLSTSNSRNGYDHRSYAPSPPPLGGASFAQSASRHGLGSSGGLGSIGPGIGLNGIGGLGGGGNNLPRSLPPVQSIPGYSQSSLGGPGSHNGLGEMPDMWSMDYHELPFPRFIRSLVFFSVGRIFCISEMYISSLVFFFGFSHRKGVSLLFSRCNFSFYSFYSTSLRLPDPPSHHLCPLFPRLHLPLSVSPLLTHPPLLVHLPSHPLDLPGPVNDLLY